MAQSSDLDGSQINLQYPYSSELDGGAQVSQKEEPVADKTVLLSLHEVTPAYETDVVTTCDWLKELGIDSATILVTPLYGMKFSNNFDRHDLFAEYLKSLGLELSLGGYSYTSKSGSPDEFKSLAQDKMVSRIRAAISLFEKGLNRRPVGFVPPIWQAPLRLVDAVRLTGLNYCAIENRLFSIPDGRTMFTSAHLVSRGTKDLNIMDLLVEIEIGGPLQIAIHPFDHNNRRVVDLLIDLRDRLGYRFAGYADYIQRYHCQPF